MSVPGQTLFDLLPALYRLRDAQLAALQSLDAADLAQLQLLQALSPPLSADQQASLQALKAKAARGPLQSLLMLIDEQFDILADDLSQRYDDHFIETCAAWVIPYIGDLIGYQMVKGIAPAVASPRAEVANTVSFRRRKGTVLVLEQLARDVTGWGAHAIEYFQKIATTQYLKHGRPDNSYSPDLRRWQCTEYMDGPFDSAAHLVDVRRISSARGRYNVQNIGIHLWSLGAYGHVRVPATAVDNGGQLFRLSPLGADVTLFNHPVSQGVDIAAPAQQVNVADRLSRPVLNADVQAGVGAVYYGEGRSVALYLSGALLNPYQIQICNLSGPDGAWANLPVKGNPYAAYFDPESGRVALVNALYPPPSAGAATPLLQASFYCGFGGDLGGGAYLRSDDFIVQSEVSVFPFPDTAGTPRYSTLQEAISFAIAQPPAAVAVEITDDGVYALAATPALTIDVPMGSTLELRAAQGSRPTLLLGGEIAVAGGGDSTVSLNGLMIAYVPPTSNVTDTVTDSPPVALVHAADTNAPDNLSIVHCTLVPGWALTSAGLPDPQYVGLPGVLVESLNTDLTIQRSIVGTLHINEEVSVSVADSIIDATDPTQVAYAAVDGEGGGGSLSLEGCTVIGKVHAAQMQISDSLVLAEFAKAGQLDAALWSDRKQQGCVRFSYVPSAAILPQQYACVAQSAQSPQPLFYSLRYGDAGYAKLLPCTDDAIRRGAQDEGEMGAFHFVLAPLRESDLRVRLQEYLPAGLEFGIFYET